MSRHILILCTLLLVTSEVAAQQRAVTVGDSLLQTLAELQDRNAYVRATAKLGTVYSGRLISYGDGTARIGDANVEFQEIAEIERRITQRPNLIRGALIGATLGLGVGFLNAAFFRYGFEQACDTSCYLYGIGSTSAGALTGALIGAATNQQHKGEPFGARPLNETGLISKGRIPVSHGAAEFAEVVELQEQHFAIHPARPIDL